MHAVFYLGLEGFFDRGRSINLELGLGLFFQGGGGCGGIGRRSGGVAGEAEGGGRGAEEAALDGLDGAVDDCVDGVDDVVDEGLFYLIEVRDRS